MVVDGHGHGHGPCYAIYTHDSFFLLHLGYYAQTTLLYVLSIHHPWKGPSDIDPACLLHITSPSKRVIDWVYWLRIQEHDQLKAEGLLSITRCLTCYKIGIPSSSPERWLSDNWQVLSQYLSSGCLFVMSHFAMDLRHRPSLFCSFFVIYVWWWKH